VELRRQFKEFVLLRRTPKLKDLPAFLQDDLDVVLVVGGNANKEDWNELPEKWKHNTKVAASGMQSHRIDRVFGTAAFGDRSRYGAVSWDDIPVHCQKDLEVVKAAVRSKYGPRFQDIPLWFRSHPDVVFAALKSGRINWEDVPFALQRNNKEIAFYGLTQSWIETRDCACLDREFLKNAIQDGKLAWQLLSEDLRHDADFARSISHFSVYEDHDLRFRLAILDDGNARGILESIPELRQERTMWLRILDSNHKSAARDNNLDHMGTDSLITDVAPAEIRSDFELMLRACTTYPSLLQQLPPTLGRDRDFLAALLGDKPEALAHVPHDLQLTFPDLVFNVATRLGQMPYKSVRHRQAYDTIAPPFWENRASKDNSPP